MGIVWTETGVRTTCVLLFGNVESSVVFDFGDGEAHVSVLVCFDEVFEHRVVASGNIGRTFDQMTCDKCRSQFVELVRFPIVPPTISVSTISRV